MLILGFAFLLLAFQPQYTAARIDSLQWLTGCWTMSSSSGVVEEQWMRPAGGTMLGMSRTVRDGKTTSFEFVQIREESGNLVYNARPSGQRAATFPLVKLGDGEAVFENPAHDFPQRIIYRRAPDGALTARVEGVVNGKVRGIDYPYKPCGR